MFLYIAPAPVLTILLWFTLAERQVNVICACIFLLTRAICILYNGWLDLHKIDAETAAFAGDPSGFRTKAAAIGNRRELLFLFEIVALTSLSMLRAYLFLPKLASSFSWCAVHALSWRADVSGDQATMARVRKLYPLLKVFDSVASAYTVALVLLK